MRTQTQNSIATEAAARATVLEALARVGNLLAVAQALDIPRGSLASFIAGAARKGTNHLVLSRVDRLSSLLAAPVSPMAAERVSVPGVRFGDHR